MNRTLVTIRRIISLIFLAATASLFLVQWPDPGFPGEIFRWPQFTPSLVAFVRTSASLATAGFIAVSVLTLLTGRTYCSSICPLGTLQDIFIRAGSAIHWQKSGHFKPLIWLKILMAAVFITGLAANIMIIVGHIDPFAVFSRIMAVLAYPVLELGLRGIAGMMKNLDVAFPYPLPPPAFDAFTVFISFLSLAVIMAMSFLRGRIFCNTLCPVGALLSIPARFAWLRIRMDKSRCNGCGLCETACKAGCIDAVNARIDSSECVSCFNCLAVCSHSALRYGTRAHKSAGRRKFMRNTGLMILSVLMLPAMKRINAGTISHTVPTNKSPEPLHPENRIPVIPPGAMDFEHYRSSCISCLACVSTCPTRVLVPVKAISGGLIPPMPVLDFSRAYCRDDCVRCGHACPTSAITKLTVKEKRTTRIGVVQLYTPDCLVYRNRTNCGACAEICPTGAVSMAPLTTRLRVPVTNWRLCTGCGACEYICPASPRKAIYVAGLKIHEKTSSGSDDGQENAHQERKGGDGFPF